MTKPSNNDVRASDGGRNGEFLRLRRRGYVLYMYGEATSVGAVFQTANDVAFLLYVLVSYPMPVL